MEYTTKPILRRPNIKTKTVEFMEIEIIKPPTTKRYVKMTLAL